MLFNIKSHLLFSLKDLSYNVSYNKIGVRESVCLITILLSVKIVDSGLYFIFHFILFYFFLVFFSFIFLFLEQLGLGVISYAVTSVTSWWQSHKTDHETWENVVEGTRTKWRHTTWTPHVGLMYYSWSFRVGCTVVSTDHGD